MNSDEALRRIGEVRIIPVVRAGTTDEAMLAIEAVLRGGIPIVELTMTIPNAPDAIRQAVRQYGKQALVGAGTVLTSEDAKRCLDAGAEFVVSPGLSIPVLTTTQACGKLAIPGALTPTELMTANAHGAKLVKIFPCGSVGGPKYLRSLKAPFPSVGLVPTGGVDVTNAADYLAAGAFAVGVGSDLVDVAALRLGHSEIISTAAQAFVAEISRVQGPVGFSS